MSEFTAIKNEAHPDSGVRLVFFKKITAVEYSRQHAVYFVSRSFTPLSFNAVRKLCRSRLAMSSSGNPTSVRSILIQVLLVSLQQSRIVRYLYSGMTSIVVSAISIVSSSSRVTMMKRSTSSNERESFTRLSISRFLAASSSIL